MEYKKLIAFATISQHWYTTSVKDKYLQYVIGYVYVFPTEQFELPVLYNRRVISTNGSIILGFLNRKSAS